MICHINRQGMDTELCHRASQIEPFTKKFKADYIQISQEMFILSNMDTQWSELLDHITQMTACIELRHVGPL